MLRFCRYKRIVAALMIAVMCLALTGCMGGQKDISKADREMYEAVIAEACEEYGYEYTEEVVLPRGAELIYVLSDGDGDVTIEVNIDEESAYEKVSCQFDIYINIDSIDECGEGIEEHLDVLLKIAEHFTDEITKDALISFINNDDWVDGQGDDPYLKDKVTGGCMNHTIGFEDGTAAEYKEGDPLVEHFVFWWDNGKEYSFKGN